MRGSEWIVGWRVVGWRVVGWRAHRWAAAHSSRPSGGVTAAAERHATALSDPGALQQPHPFERARLRRQCSLCRGLLRRGKRVRRRNAAAPRVPHRLRAATTTPARLEGGGAHPPLRFATSFPSQSSKSDLLFVMAALVRVQGARSVTSHSGTSLLERSPSD